MIMLVWEVANHIAEYAEKHSHHVGWYYSAEIAYCLPIARKSWPIFSMYMALFSVPSTETKVSKSCNVWHSTHWCQVLGLCVVGKYTQEDVTRSTVHIHKWQSLVWRQNLPPSLNTIKWCSIFQVTLSHNTSGNIHESGSGRLVRDMSSCSRYNVSICTTWPFRSWFVGVGMYI